MNEWEQPCKWTDHQWKNNISRGSATKVELGCDGRIAGYIDSTDQTGTNGIPGWTPIKSHRPITGTKGNDLIPVSISTKWEWTSTRPNGSNLIPGRTPEWRLLPFTGMITKEHTNLTPGGNILTLWQDEYHKEFTDIATAWKAVPSYREKYQEHVTDQTLGSQTPTSQMEQSSKSAANHILVRGNTNKTGCYPHTIEDADQKW